MLRVKQAVLLLGILLEGSCGFLWWKFKELVKSLVGRKPYYDERLVFLRQYLLHRVGLGRIWAITCETHDITAGPAAHAFFQMSVINFARGSGLIYLHSPINVLAGADRPMEEWAPAWEQVFNLGLGEAQHVAGRKGVVCYTHTIRELDLCFGWRDRRSELNAGFAALIPEFRRKYYANKPLARNNAELIFCGEHQAWRGYGARMG